MLMLPEVKVYLATAPTDMRKSFNGLAQWVQQEMGKDVIGSVKIPLYGS